MTGDFIGWIVIAETKTLIFSVLCGIRTYVICRVGGLSLWISGSVVAF